MKNFPIVLISLFVSITLQSCWGPGGQQITKTLNTEKFLKERDAKNDLPFTMRDESIIVPMISQKGDINLSLNIIHGIGACISVGLNEKLFVEAGGSFMQSKMEVDKSSRFEVTVNDFSSQNEPDDIRKYSSTVDYKLKTDIESYSYFVGVGKYNNFGKNGRHAYHGGLAFGSSSCASKFLFNHDYYISSESHSSTSFSEKRKYLQLFLQTDLGFATRKTEGAIYARGSWVHFTDQEFQYLPEVSTYEMSPDQFVLQPGFHLAYGSLVKGFVQCGWNIPFGNSEVEWFPTNVQLGAKINLIGKLQL